MAIALATLPSSFVSVKAQTGDSRIKESQPAYFFAPSQTFLDYFIGIGVLAYSHSGPIEAMNP